MHGSLRECGTVLGISVCEGSDDVAVDDPVDALGSPVDGVCVEGALRVGDVREATTVVCGCVALAKVVGLHLGSITTQPFPVDFVKIVRLKDDAGHNTDSGRRPHGHVDLSEEDIAIAGDGGCIGLLVDGENSSQCWVVRECSSLGYSEEVVLALGEVDLDGGSNGFISRTG